MYNPKLLTRLWENLLYGFKTFDYSYFFNYDFYMSEIKSENVVEGVLEERIAERRAMEVEDEADLRSLFDMVGKKIGHREPLNDEDKLKLKRIERKDPQGMPDTLPTGAEMLQMRKRRWKSRLDKLKSSPPQTPDQPIDITARRTKPEV